MGILDRLKTTLGRAFLPDSKAGREGRIAKHWKPALEYHRRGRYLESELEFSKALQVAEEYGPHSLELAGHLDRLADFYHSAGQYSDAEDLFRRVLEIQEANFGSQARELAPALNNLALLHYAQGRYSEGEALFERLLPILEEHLGPSDREVAICLENYAALLRKLSRDQEAGQLRARAAEIRRQLSS